MSPQGGEGSPPVPFFSPNLPGPYITCKWAMHTYKLTTKCHFCAYLYALWLDMWDMGLAIHVVEDLNDSQDPKHFFYSRAPLRFLRNCLQLSKKKNHPNDRNVETTCVWGMRDLKMPREKHFFIAQISELCTNI